MLKIYYLLLFLFCTFHSISAQEYYQDGFSWHHFFTSYFADCIHESDVVYYIEGDTTIQGNIYKKVFYHEVGANICTNPPDTTFIDRSDTVGFIRYEDRKLIYYKNDWYGDRLVYDYDWVVGDTIVEALSPSSWDIIDSISTMNFNGIERRVWHINQYRYLIEGIGMNTGMLLGPAQAFESSLSLICHDNNEQIFSINQDKPCDFISSAKHKLNYEIEVFPNPFEDYLYISFPVSIGSITLLVFDSSGHLVISMPLEKNSKNIKLNLRNLNSGFYFLKVNSMDKTFSSKLIKL